jgi:BASS family bile acid:Na+ symporter
MPSLDVLIPALVLFTMFVVGLELTPQDLERASRQPGLVATLTLAQVLLLPPLAAGIARLLRLPEEVAFGLVLAAACPAGTGSNVYTLLAGGNVALSVTLTAVGNAMAILTLPLGFVLGMSLLGESTAGVTVPPGRALAEIALAILAPAGLGMAVRGRFPEVWTRAGETLKRLCLVAIVLIVGMVLADQAVFLSGAWRDLALAAVCFTLGGSALGALASLAAREVRDRIAVVIEFPVRNQSLATLLALGSLDRREVAALAAVIVVTQATALLAGRLLVPRREAAASSILLD